MRFLLALALLCACETKQPKEAPVATSEIKAPSQPAPGSAQVKGDNFSIDTAAAPCKATAECTLTIKLVASAEYHINKDYPYKFTAAATPGVEYLGKKEATAFTRATGDFVEDTEKIGTMTVRFKPNVAGTSHVTGTYKYSVCSAERCQIEQSTLDVPVSVM